MVETDPDIKLHTDSDDLKGRIMCYHCSHSFTAPKGIQKSFLRVKCKNCGKVEERDQYLCDPDDPLRHQLGWPYDDPTIPYDC